MRLLFILTLALTSMKPLCQELEGTWNFVDKKGNTEIYERTESASWPNSIVIHEDGIKIFKYGRPAIKSKWSFFQKNFKRIIFQQGDSIFHFRFFILQDTLYVNGQTIQSERRLDSLEKVGRSYNWSVEPMRNLWWVLNNHLKDNGKKIDEKNRISNFYVLYNEKGNFEKLVFIECVSKKFKKFVGKYLCKMAAPSDFNTLKTYGLMRARFYSYGKGKGKFEEVDFW